mmetsp:Transcript_16957/g.32160  ORF Transcript_16957/g.32160 Transcript_16957/m.32160 type:complete len:481 (-) Transcript_16957:287-1729(-)
MEMHAYTISNLIRAFVYFLLAIKCLLVMRKGGPRMQMIIFALISIVLGFTKSLVVALAVVPWQFLATCRLLASLALYASVAIVVGNLQHADHVLRTMLQMPKPRMKARYVNILMPIPIILGMLSYVWLLATDKIMAMYPAAVAILLGSVFGGFLMFWGLWSVAYTLKKRIEVVKVSSEFLVAQVKKMERRMELTRAGRERDRRSAVYEEFRDYSHPEGKLSRLDKVITIKMLVDIHHNMAARSQPPRVEEERPSAIEREEMQMKMSKDLKGEGEVGPNVRGQEEETQRKGQEEETKRKRYGTPSGRMDSPGSGFRSISRKHAPDTKKRGDSMTPRSTSRTIAASSSYTARSSQHRSELGRHIGVGLYSKSLTVSLLNFETLRVHLLKMIVIVFVASVCVTLAAVRLLIELRSLDPYGPWHEVVLRKTYSDTYSVSTDLRSSVTLLCNVGLVYLVREVQVQRNNELSLSESLPEVNEISAT